MNAENYRLLVVEDEEDLNEILQFNLEGEGYHVDTVFSTEEALTRDLAFYHLILLDVKMGELSGFGLAQKIRKELNLQTHLIFVTARNDENDLLTGYNLGADDYITKPFSVQVLMARVKAVLMRSKIFPAETISRTVISRDIIIDSTSRRLLIGVKKVELTRREYEIISLLTESPGKIFSRDEILKRIGKGDVVVNDRTVDIIVTRLRHKLKEYGSYIQTKTGFGYYFEINKTGKCI